MRPLVATALTVFASAALAAAPAAAHDYRHYHGGWHGGANHYAGGPYYGGYRHHGGWQGGGRYYAGSPYYYGGYRHHGGWRRNDWAGPALIFGLGAAAIAGAIASSQRYECTSYEAVYDDWGNYVGRRAVYVC